MSCCGQTRTLARESTEPAAANHRPPDAAPAPRSLDSSSGVWLRYVGASSVSVRGPVTRREYRFSSLQQLQRVDARDAVHLLRTRAFQKTW